MLLELPAVYCPIVELRQYTLHPGRRDTLVALFEREFLDTQEAAGIDVLGQFRDLDDPDRFTWLRGFPDMDARLAALSAFYGGPAWAAHREAANATMIDSDDVLLLKPVAPASGFALDVSMPHVSHAPDAPCDHQLQVVAVQSPEAVDGIDPADLRTVEQAADWPQAPPKD